MSSIVGQGLPFEQQVLLAFLTFGLSSAGLAIFFWIVFRTDLFSNVMRDMMKIIGKDDTYKTYNCNCDRCKGELMTKKGRKRWARDHRYKKEDMV